jgi:hypothetical protein
MKKVVRLNESDLLRVVKKKCNLKSLFDTTFYLYLK